MISEGMFPKDRYIGHIGPDEASLSSEDYPPLRLSACLDAALAWACLPGNQSQPQAMKIERLGALPGAGGAWEAASKQALFPAPGSKQTLFLYSQHVLSK